MISSISDISASYASQGIDILKKSSPSEGQRNVISDSVDIGTPYILMNNEADNALAAVEQSLSGNAADALSVHDGLNMSRVMALLAD